MGSKKITKKQKRGREMKRGLWLAVIVCLLMGVVLAEGFTGVPVVDVNGGEPCF